MPFSEAAPQRTEITKELLSKIGQKAKILSNFRFTYFSLPVKIQNKYGSKHIKKKWKHLLLDPPILCEIIHVLRLT